MEDPVWKGSLRVWKEVLGSNVVEVQEHFGRATEVVSAWVVLEVAAVAMEVAAGLGVVQGDEEVVVQLVYLVVGPGDERGVVGSASEGQVLAVVVLEVSVQAASG